MAVKRRRSKWSEAFRQRIVAEAEVSEEPMSEVAKRHGLNPKLLYSWRQKSIKEQEAATGKEVCLLPVEVKAPAEEALVNMPVNTNDINPALLSQALSVLRSDIQATAL